MNSPSEDLYSKSTKELHLELGVTPSFKWMNVEKGLTAKHCLIDSQAGSVGR